MIRRLLLLGAMCAAFSATSSASLLIKQVGGPTGIGGGLYQYQYTATLLSGFTLRNNDFFTLYDIFQLPTTGPNAPTFTPDSGLPGGTTFAVTTPLIGDTPVGISSSVRDQAAYANITVQLTGPDVTASSGNILLGTLTFAAGTNAELRGYLTSQTFSNQLQSDDLQIGFPSLPTPAPEPGSLALLGGGLVGLAFGARRRKK